MVKSKKMSKSTVAIVLLSLLLVLSLILTATGAWFTASADKTTNGAQGGSWTLGDFITLSVAGSDNSAVVAKTSLGGADESVITDGILHPGDKIYITDGAEITISANDDKHNFWYVVSYDGGANWEGNAAKAYVAGNVENKQPVLATATISASITDESSLGEQETGYYEIKTSLTTENSGTVAVSIAGANVIVRAVQYNNFSATDAYTYLTNGTNFAA